MPTEDIKWIAFFSQTGAEIADIAEEIGRWPTRIITNKRPDNLRVIDPRIVKQKYLEVPNKPSYDQYEEILQYFNSPILTLHGWLRIMPPQLCEKYEIYNGHPGLITKYPELKGKDPQVKAYYNNHSEIGSVIHKVNQGVDEGKVLKSSSLYIKGLTLDEHLEELKNLSLYLWVDFLRDLLKIK